ncbi:hypothetical protein AB7W88_10375 [Providencia vermicola]|uniref:Uncharacterized protein n=2 Tax=Providencia TaxID=586 RepID=A0AAI9MVQ6_PROST|nr:MULTISPECIES: hypothetical protein [Providencia]ELR5035034.1 hypothetical protein [Providencia stuartii]ELR5144133.1 hypothetical protein [Providencia stuartii]ELX8379785.1 hypothetical protein [Providencia stuartii]EMD5259175.1 hypothetical protein [Providencia stuartii]MTB40624.1 hypothetical protein [Providencia sp. wls1949]
MIKSGYIDEVLKVTESTNSNSDNSSVIVKCTLEESDEIIDLVFSNDDKYIAELYVSLLEYVSPDSFFSLYVEFFSSPNRIEQNHLVKGFKLELPAFLEHMALSDSESVLNNNQDSEDDNIMKGEIYGVNEISKELDSVYYEVITRVERGNYKIVLYSENMKSFFINYAGMITRYNLLPRNTIKLEYIMYVEFYVANNNSELHYSIPHVMEVNKV